MSWKCECKFDGRKCNSNQKRNYIKCWCEKSCVWKNYIWNAATCSCENGKYAGSIIDNSMITCDEVIDETKTVTTKNVTTNSTFSKFLCYSPFY